MNRSKKFVKHLDTIWADTFNKLQIYFDQPGVKVSFITTNRTLHKYQLYII